MRVGRAAIDEDAIRQLEQHNPDVQFDWTRILKQPVSGAPHSRQPARPSQHERREPPAPAVPRAPRSEPAPERPVEVAAEDASFQEHGPPPDIDPIEERETAPEADERQPAAFARLGAEGLARLRARYAEVMARIGDRPLEDAVRDELQTRAERLNPDAWVTDDEVREGLEQYESTFESLRSVVGHPRRRRRRRS